MGYDFSPPLVTVVLRTFIVKLKGKMTLVESEGDVTLVVYTPVDVKEWQFSLGPFWRSHEIHICASRID